MKKKTILAMMLLILLGVSTVLQAQSSGKKKKKKKAKTTHISKAEQARMDSMAAMRAADSIATAGKIADSTKAAQVIADSIAKIPDLLVADTSTMAYYSFPLDSTRPVDGFYKIPLLRGAKPFALPDVSKYDIKFYKRLWRTIDLTDSLNKIFAMPGETLMGVIMEAIKAEKLIAYADEKFTSRYTYNKVMKMLSDSSIVPDFDSTGVQIGSHAVFNSFNPESVTKFEIKEDIYYDKVHSRVITLIVGLAPVKKVLTSTGDYVGVTHPFWLYFPQCRYSFAGREVYDTRRDIYNESYDDIFVQHNFKGVIVKESSPDDMSIEAKYPNDEEKQKKEAERIETELRNFKKNLWKY